MGKPPNSKRPQGGENAGDADCPTSRKRAKRDDAVQEQSLFQRAALVAAVERSTREISPSLDAAAVRDGARELFLTDDGASWLYYVPQWYRRIYVQCREMEAEEELADPYAEWFERVWQLHPEECGTIKLFGKDIRTPRFQQAYGVTHRFSGATFPSKPFPPVLQHAITILQRMLVDPATGTTRLQAGLLNWYADGDHYMGPHSDEGVSIRAGSPIVSLTLGPASRRFVFTARKAAAKTGLATVKLELELGDGDLLIMGGTTQQTHKHALPKMKRCRDRRVNVTLRFFK